MDWEHRYEGEKKPSPQQKALNQRARRGLKMCPPHVTKQRVGEIVDLMQRGLWFSSSSAQEHATKWGVSVKRVQQLVAEANRING